MTHAVTLLIRVMLVALLGVCVFAQAIVFPIATDFASYNPEVAHLVTPYSLAAIAALVCVELAFVALWRLLAMVGADKIFTPAAFRWVDLIIGCITLATLITAAVWVYMMLTPGAATPLVALGVTALIPGGIALGLLVVVLRGLLTSAVAARSELDEVI